jgi:guanylate kinase
MKLESELSNYKMTDATKQLINKTKLLLIASVTGGGKDTIVNELLKSDVFHLIVTHTTRKPRMNHGVWEKDGEDYHFISIEQANIMLDNREFVEAKINHGNIYGTSVAEIKQAYDRSKIAVTDIDIQGVVEYLDVKPDTHAIFLLPPSVDTWLNRLQARYGKLEDHSEEIDKRFQTAYNEIQYILSDDRFILIINDDLDTTAQRVRGVVDGSINHSSEYATSVAEHILDYLKTKI